MSNVHPDIEKVARDLCSQRGIQPGACAFGSGFVGMDASGKVTSGTTCSRYAWEDFISEALRLIQARAEGRREGIEEAAKAIDGQWLKASNQATTVLLKEAASTIRALAAAAGKDNG